MLLLSLLALVLPLCALSAPSASYGGWQAAWSVDGKMIAFTAGLPHSTSNIWVIGADGVGSRQVTKLGGYDPVWSFDGREIIFQSDRGLGPRYYAHLADGTGDDRLFDRLPAGAASAAWSPDGKKIVYAVVEEGKQKTYLVDQSTGDKRELRHELVARQYCWSPDCKKIALVTGDIIGDSILQFDLATDKLEHVYHGYCSAVSYSPDGARLAFAAPLGKNRHRLVVVELASKKETKFEVTEFDGKSLSWSRDGHSLLFASATKGFPARLWTAVSSGGKPTAFKGSYEWAGRPQYSPMGDSIVFEAVGKGGFGTDVYVCRASGARTKRITACGASYWTPRWSPSGKLAVLTDVGGRGQVLLVDPDKGDKRPIGAFQIQQGCRTSFAPDGEHVVLVREGVVTTMSTAAKTPEMKNIVQSVYPTSVSWSPDGKTIYYVDGRMKGLGISSVKVEGKDRFHLTPRRQEGPKPDSAASDPAATEPPKEDTVDICPAASPDGKSIAFIRGSEVWVVGTDGSNERVLVKSDAGPADAITYPTWSGDGGLILFQLHRKLEDGLAFELWTAKSDGTEMRRAYSRKITSQFDVYSEDSTNPAQVTPDGKSAIVTLAGDAGWPDLWLVDLADRKAKRLTETGGTFPSLSSDGKALAYTSLDGGREVIRILDLLSGQSRNVRL
jgi:Tol biopolymer transport system component